MTKAHIGTALALAASLVTGQTKPANAEDKPAATTPTALFATVCVKTSVRGKPQGLCEEFQIVPGEVGSVFPSMEACTAGKDQAMEKWFKNAGPGLGITGREDNPRDHWVGFERCGPPETVTPVGREAEADTPRRAHQPVVSGALRHNSPRVA